MRELVRAYQAFEMFDSRLLRSQGLTTCQADVLFTLGNTSGMSFKELGERTLITKGTLTGVVDRMAAKGLVVRRPSPEDGRSTIALLTRKGERLFEERFPAHIARLKERFDRLSKRELDQSLETLERLRAIFDAD